VYARLFDEVDPVLHRVTDYTHSIYATHRFIRSDSDANLGAPYCKAYILVSWQSQ